MSQRRSRLSFHGINVGVEMLESRLVPSGSSGHGPAHAAEVVSSSHGSPSRPDTATDISHTHLTGKLVSNDPLVTATGSVSFESAAHKGKTSSELNVQVSGLAPNTSFDVTVTTVTGTQTNTVTIGKITTNAAGVGHLKISSQGKAHPLPANSPPITDTSVIKVGANLSATLAAPTPELETETKFKATLSDPSGASKLTAEAEFESETEQGVTVRVFKVDIKKGTPGTTLDVKIGATSVGSILVDASGKGSIILSSHPVDGQSLPFPTTFPTSLDGSAITVGVATGKFVKSR